MNEKCGTSSFFFSSFRSPKHSPVFFTDGKWLTHTGAVHVRGEIGHNRAGFHFSLYTLSPSTYPVRVNNHYKAYYKAWRNIQYILPYSISYTLVVNQTRVAEAERKPCSESLVHPSFMSCSVSLVYTDVLCADPLSPIWHCLPGRTFKANHVFRFAEYKRSYAKILGKWSLNYGPDAGVYIVNVIH